MNENHYFSRTMPALVPIFEPYFEAPHDAPELAFLGRHYDIEVVEEFSQRCFDDGFDHYWVRHESIKQTLVMPNRDSTTTLLDMDSDTCQSVCIDQTVRAVLLASREYLGRLHKWGVSMYPPCDLATKTFDIDLLWGRHRVHRSVCQYDFYLVNVALGEQQILLDFTIDFERVGGDRPFVFGVEVLFPRSQGTPDPRWCLPDEPGGAPEKEVERAKTMGYGI